MEQFVIRGGVPLRGSVQPAGNKNSAMPLLAACLLTDQPVTLHNMPLIQDVQTMRQLVEAAGATVELLAPRTWRIHAAKVSGDQLDPELCSAIRASILLAGPLLARCGQLQLAAPGGDVIGRRRLDTHLLALRALAREAPRGADAGMPSSCHKRPSTLSISTHLKRAGARTAH